MKKQFITLSIFLSIILHANVFLGQSGLRVGTQTLQLGQSTIIGELTPTGGIFGNNAMLNIISSNNNTAGIHYQREGRQQNVKVSLTGTNTQWGLMYQIRNGIGDYVRPLKLVETGQVIIGLEINPTTNNSHINGINGPDYNDVRLFVGGTILGEELRIEEINWADYVFEKDYSLPTLGDVESFIEKNGHLPGVPAGAEVENKGLRVGAMTVKQQEKIEELFLYVIELNKEMKNLNKEVETLNEENEQLRLEVSRLQSKD